MQVRYKGDQGVQGCLRWFKGFQGGPFGSLWVQKIFRNPKLTHMGLKLNRMGLKLTHMGHKLTYTEPKLT